MAMTLIRTNTTSNSDYSDFKEGTNDVVFDNTYKLYVFKFIDLNPATDGVIWNFQSSTDAGSSWGVATTTTIFRAQHTEADSAALAYEADYDIHNSTAANILAYPLGNGADESAAGEMYLFNPSNTTYVKHWHARCACYMPTNGVMDNFSSGLINTTSAIDGIRFYMHSGNQDSIIKMYGVG